ncbi:hypothetical protein FJY84_00460 [Candidatus Bathyarchaeota archaeon]|nr:hypothetical protein [Candidatus Bathyarchaeota archaeon]
MALSKLGKIDYRLIYAFMTIITFIPLLVPIGIPTTVGSSVKNYVAKIRSYPAGSVVLTSFSGYITMLPDVEPIYVATYKLLFAQNLKILILLSDVDAPIVINQVLSKVGAAGKVEGRDYVIFPYMAMDEAAHVVFTNRIRDYFTTDRNGNSLDDAVKVPMMKDIKDYHDIDLYVSGGMSARYWNWCGIPLVSWGTGTGLLPFVGPFYDPERGPIFGFVGGASQGGELEVWTGYLGDGIKTNDAKNLGIITLCVIIIVGNLSMLGKEEKK